MNARNVEALHSEICAAYDQSRPGDVTSESVRHLSVDALAWLARFLAARGVLVPAALTDEQCASFEEVQLLPQEPGSTRAHLARIAKGET